MPASGSPSAWGTNSVISASFCLVAAQVASSGAKAAGGAGAGAATAVAGGDAEEASDGVAGAGAGEGVDAEKGEAGGGVLPSAGSAACVASVRSVAWGGSVGPVGSVGSVGSVAWGESAAWVSPAGCVRSAGCAGSAGSEISPVSTGVAAAASAASVAWVAPVLAADPASAILPAGWTRVPPGDIEGRGCGVPDESGSPAGAPVLVGEPQPVSGKAGTSPSAEVRPGSAMSTVAALDSAVNSSDGSAGAAPAAIDPRLPTSGHRGASPALPPGPSRGGPCTGRGRSLSDCSTGSRSEPSSRGPVSLVPSADGSGCRSSGAARAASDAGAACPPGAESRFSSRRSSASLRSWRKMEAARARSSSGSVTAASFYQPSPNASITAARFHVEQRAAVRASGSRHHRLMRFALLGAARRPERPCWPRSPL